MRVDERVKQAFQDRFGCHPDFLVRAPGRINLIGDHADYSDGFVMPLAIDYACWIALRPRTDRQVSVCSLDFDEEVLFDLHGLQRSGSSWIEYLKGVAWALEESGRHLVGWEGVMAGDVPIGAGFSSSSALELATARAFATSSAFEWEPIEMARVARQAENQWVGTKCSVIDQMISAMGVADHAVLIDRLALTATPVRLPTGSVVVVIDPETREKFAESAYSERRSRCEDAARFFGVKKLREVGRRRFATQAEALPDAIRRCASHVISENSRVLAAARVMRGDSAIKLGRLPNASHNSLRDDFQMSSPESDVIVAIARHEPACYGARMTDAGFAVALVRAAGVVGFVDSISAHYKYRTNLSPKLYAEANNSQDERFEGALHGEQPTSTDCENADQLVKILASTGETRSTMVRETLGNLINVNPSGGTVSRALDTALTFGYVKRAAIKRDFPQSPTYFVYLTDKGLAQAQSLGVKPIPSDLRRCSEHYKDGSLIAVILAAKDVLIKEGFTNVRLAPEVPLSTGLVHRSQLSGRQNGREIFIEIVRAWGGRHPGYESLAESSAAPSRHDLPHYAQRIVPHDRDK